MLEQGMLDAVLSAHGGLKHWERVESIATSARGIFPLMMIKGVAPLWRRFDAEIEVHQPRVRFRDYPKPGMEGVFDHWNVSVNDPDGHARQRGYAPAPGDTRPRFRYVWDDLDLLFFAGYALWNYLVTPFVFTRPGFECRELAPVHWRGEWLHRMEVTYPDDMPKHCRTQRYFLDEGGLIRRFDYRADVIGRWAAGAHLCSRYECFDGLYYPCRREVYGGWIPRLIPPFPPAVIADFLSIEPRMRE